MEYDVKTPNEYLEILEKDWRKDKLIEVREMIKKSGPELTEGIYCKMLSYTYTDNIIFCLNAQMAYVSLYVGNVDKVENSRKLLKEFNIGKGCIRIKKVLICKNRILRILSQTLLKYGEEEAKPIVN